MRINQLAAALLAWIGAGGLVDAGASIEGYPAVHRTDGSRIEWYLDRQGATSRQGILVLAQGSGCASATINSNLIAARAVRPDFAIVMVDKYGVHPGDRGDGGHGGCPAVFYAHHTISLRADDYLRVVQTAERAAWWNGRLVLFGGSEGGAVVQLIAKQLHPDAAVIFSSATGMPFGEAFVKVLPPTAAPEARAEVAYARAHPDSPEVWGGNAYKWWADIVDRRLWRDAQEADVPMLVVQGARDRSNPVESARAFRDAFATAHRCRLTYWEYTDYDHQMADTEGQSHLTEVLARIAQWVNAREAGVDQADCTDR